MSRMTDTQLYRQPDGPKEYNDQPNRRDLRLVTNSNKNNAVMSWSFHCFSHRPSFVWRCRSFWWTNSCKKTREKERGNKNVVIEENCDISFFFWRRYRHWMSRCVRDGPRSFPAGNFSITVGPFLANGEGACASKRVWSQCLLAHPQRSAVGIVWTRVEVHGGQRHLRRQKNRNRARGTRVKKKKYPTREQEPKSRISTTKRTSSCPTSHSNGDHSHVLLIELIDPESWDDYQST